MMLGGVAATAARRTFPFRVYSFPKEIVVSELFLLEPDPEPIWVYRMVFIDGRGYVRTGERYKSLWAAHVALGKPYVSP